MENQRWNIDTAHSSVSFSVRHMMFAKVRGRFASWQGSVQLDPNDLRRSQVTAEIDAASIDTGVADRDAHLRSADFLDAEHFPKLSFASTRIERIEGDRYRLHGQLTIRDVTREVALEVEHSGQGKDPWGNQRMGFTAKTSLDRREFGLRWNQALEAGGVLVGERVEIELELEAVQASAQQAA